MGIHCWTLAFFLVCRSWWWAFGLGLQQPLLIIVEHGFVMSVFLVPLNCSWVGRTTSSRDPDSFLRGLAILQKTVNFKSESQLLFKFCVLSYNKFGLRKATARSHH